MVNTKELNNQVAPFTYATYQFYGPKGHRLAVFYHEGKVTAIHCNKNDQFSKKVAKLLYSTKESNKTTFDLKFDSQKKFIEWCEDVFDKYYYTTLPANIKDVQLIKYNNKLDRKNTEIKFLA